MPKGYEEIKASLRKEHPNWTLAHVKEVAAKIWNSKHKGGDTVGRGRK